MEQSSSLWHLDDIDLSSIFRQAKASAPKHQAYIVEQFRKNDYIYLPKDESSKIYFLEEGRVKIGMFNDAGREITKAILGKGEIFGEFALIGEERRRDFAQALEDVTVCILDRDELRSLLRDHNALSLFFMKIFGSRMLEVEQRLESLIFKDSRSRIIEFLHQFARKRGQPVGFEMLVRQFLTHQEIANLTATSRQSVNAVLNDLRDKNILTFNRKRLLVRDMERLAKEISHPDRSGV
jgi:CRP-like cAMP-binding protein